MDSCLSKVKRNQPHPRFELGSPILFSTTVTITLSAVYALSLSLSLSIYIYIYIYIYIEKLIR